MRRNSLRRICPAISSISKKFDHDCYREFFKFICLQKPEIQFSSSILRTDYRNSCVGNLIVAGRRYVSVKSCSERRASLDLVPLDANLQLTSIVYVTREEKIIRLVGFV